MHSIVSSSECQLTLSTKSQVMLKFSAEWCGPCKAVAPAIEKLAPQYTSVFMADVDIDKAQDVAAAHNITAVPSFVFFHNGVEVDRVKGGDIARVTAALRSLAAKTPSFGKGYRVGATPVDGTAKTSAVAPPSAAELRAARARAFLTASGKNNESRADASKASLGDEKVTAKKAANPQKAPDLSTVLSNLVFYVILYVATLFSFDARAKAAALNRRS